MMMVLTMSIPTNSPSRLFYLPPHKDYYVKGSKPFVNDE